MPYHVTLGTIAVRVDTIDEVLALTLHVSAPYASPAAPSPSKHFTALSPIERMIECLHRPSARWQRRLLHILKTHGGEPVDRDTICIALGIVGERRALIVGGLVQALNKRAARLGVRITDIVIRSATGIAAGSRLLSGTPALPTEDPATMPNS